MPQNGLQSPNGPATPPHGSLLAGFPNILCSSRAAFLSMILFPGLPFYTRCSVPQTLTNPCILDGVELALNLNLSFSGRPLQSLKVMIRGPSCSPTPQVLPHVTHTTTHAESIHPLLSTNGLPEGRDCVHSVILCPQHTACLLIIIYLAQTGLLCWLSSKESACHSKRHRRQGSIPGLGRVPGGGHGNPLQ